ncbi:MAG: hypothetical protein LBJ35_02680 [Spirochaetaceae bacterium]|nr:hypothetical protein [Spirochaetaceae bacterium]
MNFSENIENLLTHFNVTRAGLEKILGLSNGYLGNIEKKMTDNPGKLLVALSENGISADWFLTGKSEMLLAPFSTQAGREVARTDETYRVPLLRQQVSCGKGANWEDEQNIKDYIDIFSLVPRLNAGRLFAFTVQGTSMIGAGIKNGDYVLFNSDVSHYSADGIYVFALDNEVYCKRLEFDKLSKKIKIYSVRVADLEKAELLTSLDIDETEFADRFRIFGRVVSWLHPYSSDD